MQTHGYERSTPWKQALALLDHIQSLADAFDNDTFGLAGKLKSHAADLPIRCAVCFEQPDYAGVQQHAAAINEHLFKLVLHAQLATHLGLLTPKQLAALRQQIDAIDSTVAALPDELFEDDEESQLADAA